VTADEEEGDTIIKVLNLHTIIDEYQRKTKNQTMA
jgi:hypothetical protein